MPGYVPEFTATRKLAAHSDRRLCRLPKFSLVCPQCVAIRRGRRAEEKEHLYRDHDKSEADHRVAPTLCSRFCYGPVEIDAPKEKRDFKCKGDRRVIPKPEADLERIVIERRIRPMHKI